MNPIKINVLLSDITTLRADAIVNAANSSLMGGGGVDGAIHHAGGPAILEECMAIVAKQGGCKTGEAVITTGGNLPAKFVIHTVGPVWHGGDQQEVKKLKQCYENSIRLAVENNCAAIAFPNISTGAYGFPKEDAARIAVQAVSEAVKNQDVIKEVIFVCFDKTNYELVERELLNIGTGFILPFNF